MLPDRFKRYRQDPLRHDGDCGIYTAEFPQCTCGLHHDLKAHARPCEAYPQYEQEIKVIGDWQKSYKHRTKENAIKVAREMAAYEFARVLMVKFYVIRKKYGNVVLMRDLQTELRMLHAAVLTDLPEADTFRELESEMESLKKKFETLAGDIYDPTRNCHGCAGPIERSCHYLCRECLNEFSWFNLKDEIERNKERQDMAERLAACSKMASDAIITPNMTQKDLAKKLSEILAVLNPKLSLAQIDT
jgi:hypothetical protein